MFIISFNIRQVCIGEFVTAILLVMMLVVAGTVVHAGIAGWDNALSVSSQVSSYHALNPVKGGEEKKEKKGKGKKGKKG